MASGVHRRRSSPRTLPPRARRPPVSAVVPAHNEEATIAACVRTLLDGV
ncbi:hypothetical protein [Streptomyces sp. NPDC001594]